MHAAQNMYISAATTQDYMQQLQGPTSCKMADERTSIHQKLLEKSEQLLSIADEDSPNVPGLLWVCNKHLEDMKGLILDALGRGPQQVHH